MIYQRDALIVDSKAHRGFNQLWNARRCSIEPIKNFELRCSFQVAKFNSISTTTTFLECITASMLLPNSSINDSQTVSVIAPAASSACNLNAQPIKDAFLDAIKYQSVALVVTQCNQHSHTIHDNNPLSANSARFVHNSHRHHGNKGNSQEKHVLMKFPCDSCEKCRHWKRNHNPNGSQPARVKPFECPNQSSNGKRPTKSGQPSDSAHDSNTNRKKNTYFFNLALLIYLSSFSLCNGAFFPTKAICDGTTFLDTVNVA